MSTGPRGEMRTPERVVERGEAPQLPVSRKGRNAPRTLWADDAGNPYYSYGPGRDVPLVQPSRPQAAAVAQVIQQQGGVVGNGPTGPTGPTGPLEELPVQTFISIVGDDAVANGAWPAAAAWIPTVPVRLTSIAIHVLALRTALGTGLLSGTIRTGFSRVERAGFRVECSTLNGDDDLRDAVDTVAMNDFVILAGEPVFIDIAIASNIMSVSVIIRGEDA